MFVTFNRNKMLKFGAFRRYFCHHKAKNIKDGKFVQSAAHDAKTFGQPTFDTHPYLIKPNEITPHMTKSEYRRRRERLVEAIAAYVKKSNPGIEQHLIIIPSATKLYMSDKIPYFFRQNTDFLYLTGCLEPDSCLVIAVNEKTVPFSTLFMRQKDDHSELWDGPRTGPHEAAELFGVDQSIAFDELENYLGSYSKGRRNMCLFYDFTSAPQPKVHKTLIEYLNDTGKKFWESPRSFVHKLRLIKSRAEVDLMQKSCDVASNAISETIRASNPGINEAQIFAKVDYECRMNGAEYLAYPPVVAGGRRANVIHYINNNQVVKDGEMVLMDAGCELHGYSSDITRTWPISGCFSPEQRELYEVVLNTQKELIKICEKPISLDHLFECMCQSLGKGLQEIGLVSLSLNASELRQAAYEFCPHHVSHYLGMDVHDTPLITRNIPIQPGMIITVEPGIYVGKKHRHLPEKYRGLGIRIEDDVLITKDGPIVLTRNCPKEVDDIETIAAKK